MSSEDRLVAALYRGCANTKYTIDALNLQSITRHKAEQMGGSLQFLCRFWSMTPEQKDKATEWVTGYNETLTMLLPNPIPNREKIAQFITEQLVIVDDLIVKIIANPDRQAQSEPIIPDDPPVKIDKRTKAYRLTTGQTQQ